MMSRKPSEFERAAQGRQPGLWIEFVVFLKQNKKLWLLPLIVVMLLLAALIWLTGTSAAPFIYTLF
jgi:hypothetical protein